MLFGLVAAQPANRAPGENFKLVVEVPRQDSAAFGEGARFPAVFMDTPSWEATPYLMRPVVSRTMRLAAGQRAVLAGDPSGANGFEVDNFLLFEVRHGETIDRFIVGGLDRGDTPHYGGAGGPVLRQVGANAFSLEPLDLTDELPVDEPFTLTVAALDYGGVGYSSDVYLVLGCMSAVPIMTFEPGGGKRASADERAVASSSVMGVFWDFETAVSPCQWSHTSIDHTPAGGRRFLGQFGNEQVTLSLQELPAHATVTVSFDLFLINSWDGSDTTFGPDGWGVRLGDGTTLLQTTFSNLDEEDYMQRYPGTVASTLYPPHTGAREVDSLGYTYYGDSVYRIERTFAHTGDTLELVFWASGLQELADESWGLDNLRIELDRVGESAEASQPRFTLRAPTVRDVRFVARRSRLESDIERVERRLETARDERKAAVEELERLERDAAEGELLLEQAAAAVAARRQALAELAERIESLELDISSMPSRLANLYRAKRDLEGRIERAIDRIAEAGADLPPAERERLLRAIDSAQRQLVPIDRAIAERMAEIDAQPRGAGGPITFAQREADKAALRAQRPELERQLEQARREWEAAFRQLSRRRTDLQVAVGQAQLHQERVAALEVELQDLRAELSALGELGDLGVVRGQASGRLVFEGRIDRTAFDRLREMRRQLVELRRQQAWFDERRGELRGRFVDLTNEVIALEQQLIDEMWDSFWKLYGTEVWASASNLVVSGLTGGPGGVLADALMQIGGNFVFNEGGVAFETFDESAMRSAFHQRAAEIERETRGDEGDAGNHANDDDVNACTGTNFDELARVDVGAGSAISWTAGAAETAASINQAGLHATKEIGGNAAQLVHVGAKIEEHRDELRNLNRALRNGVRNTTISTPLGHQYLAIEDAIARERQLLTGWERKLDDFFTLKGWGGTAAKSTGSFVAGLLIEEVKDAAQAAILAEERDAWAAFFEKELAASLTWMAFMRASCVYWTVTDEVEFLSEEYEALRAALDPLKDFVVEVNEAFSSEEELVLTVPFSGEGGFRVEVRVAGVRGEPRGDQQYVFPAGSFEAFADGSELEVVIEVLPE